jgi:uncharacterized protein YqgV (UPF0045/DUF77 family)
LNESDRVKVNLKISQRYDSLISMEDKVAKIDSLMSQKRD